MKYQPKPVAKRGQIRRNALLILRPTLKNGASRKENSTPSHSLSALKLLFKPKQKSKRMVGKAQRGLPTRPDLETNHIAEFITERVGKSAAFTHAT